MSSNTTLSTQLLKIHQILCATYGAPFPYFSNKSPLDELVSALLSHRTKNRITAKAYRALRTAYPSWEDMLQASEEEVIEHIQGVTYAEQKARRLLAILQQIKTENEGHLSLDFLSEYEVAAARTWLESFSGVGPKTSAAVLNFSTLRRPALVVDSHHLRVAERLGLVKAKTPISKAAYQLEALLPEDWGGREYYDHHEALMYHGQKCCYYRNPACGQCPVRELCPSAG